MPKPQRWNSLGAADGITLRRATIDDAGALSEAAARLFFQAYDGAIAAAEMENYVRSNFGPELQRAEIADPGCVALVALSGKRPVGYAQVRRADAPDGTGCPARAQLWRIYVDRAWHGTGLGARLLAEAAAAAREFSGIGMWLAVWEQNPRAIAFYLKHGFTPVGRQAFRVGSEVQSDLVLCSPGLAS